MIQELARLLNGVVDTENGRPTCIKFDWGGELYIRESYGRISIGGGFPSAGGQHWKPYGEDFDISVGDRKTVERIARDVERRLLPRYQAAYLRAVALMQSYEDKHAALQAQCAKLAGMFQDGKPSQYEQELRFHTYDSGVEGEIHSDGTVTLKISCDAEMAERLCKEISRC
jgi:hypothetical protein